MPQLKNIIAEQLQTKILLAQAKRQILRSSGMPFKVIITEELYALDMRDGTEIARITDQHYPNGVMRTNQFDIRIYSAKSSGAKIMFIHNHPSGSPPSVGDFNALLSVPDAYGITVGHDGSVYRYSAPKNKVLPSDFEVAILNYKRYSYITAHEKALSEISEKYGFTFERM